MNREDIVRMAQETGVTAERVRDLVNFASLVASAEREACEALCKWRTGIQQVDAAIDTCAAAIRARGQE